MQAERRAALVLLSTTVIWGSTFFSSKLGLAAIAERSPATGALAGAMVYMALRFLLACALFAACLPRSVRRLGVPTIKATFWVALPGFFGIALQNVSLPGGSSAMVAFLTSLTVVTVPLLGWVVFREKLTRSLWIGGAIALAGIVIMTRPWTGKVGVPEICALSCAVVFGAQMLLVNHFTPKHNPEAMTLGLLLHYLWMSVAVLALLPDGRALLDPKAIVSLFEPLAEGTPMARYAVAWTVPYLTVFGSIVAVWAFMKYQKDMPATRAAIIYCFEPVLAAVIPWTLGFEALKGVDVAGGVVILAGNLACEALRRGETAPAPGPSPVRAAGASPPGTTAPPNPGR